MVHGCFVDWFKNQPTGYLGVPLPGNKFELENPDCIHYIKKEKVRVCVPF
jgi:hypothetical protein